MACVLYKLCIHAHSLHVCVKEGVYVGLYVLGLLFSRACICIYVCTSVCLNMEWVCAGIHLCADLCMSVCMSGYCVVSPQLSAKAPGMIPYSYFPFCQFSIIL